MSSQEIADLVGSRHDNVKRAVERIASKGVIQLPPMEEVKNHLGQAVEQYLFSGEKGKRDSIVVVAQLSPEFTAELVDRWQKLEEQVAAPALPTDYISALEHLLASKRSEQQALEQRDHAIATKAEIGSRREATAMATASAAVRKVMHLENELGRGCQHATVTAVERAAHRSFGSQGFRPLKNWCDSHGVSAPKVQDPRFGWVRSWPAAAWAAVYQIDLAELFGAVGEPA
ncbi:hypothetical protein CXB65_06240 [Pseudomonas monteilii]|uniref:Uncharacterized protein n=2 Tax=Pseudomonas monteilii TaxID=76759 RepID=A0A2N1IW16_9PSED|nr:hypothetical protein CXB65_06240 [Pseudomonas monteilii]RPD93986.1 ORF6N domain-containing protein [Pseudomonas monteilii]